VQVAGRLQGARRRLRLRPHADAAAPACLLPPQAKAEVGAKAQLEAARKAASQGVLLSAKELAEVAERAINPPPEPQAARATAAAAAKPKPAFSELPRTRLLRGAAAVVRTVQRESGRGR
jgi:hypothetical protein